MRQQGVIFNQKRLDQLYAGPGLQVKKRRRKKICLSDRHHLERLTFANLVDLWTSCLIARMKVAA
uniref:Transposase n=1 Tax=Curvibacter symbiont subsp. Hydra magnipapillata TaxID=667019 RepID=C9Y946_CURXX|nr:hypothetical protein Csp_A06470 [Curvibacter putative symbiont of Hydra magnipapillata]